MENNQLSVSINDENCEVTITFSQEFINRLLLKNYGKSFQNSVLLDTLKAAKNAADEVITQVSSDLCAIKPSEKITPPPSLPEEKIVDDTFNVRKRIPNKSRKQDSNVIDLNTLKVENAQMKKVLVRCPNCGQAHVCLAMNNEGSYLLMIRDFKVGEFKIVGEPFSENEFFTVSKKEEVDPKDYFKDLQKFLENAKDIDLTLGSESLLHCPSCQKSDTLYNWVTAYQEPLHFFETEHICDICGGDLLEVRNRKTAGNAKTHCLVCEDCGQEKIENEEN